MLMIRDLILRQRYQVAKGNEELVGISTCMSVVAASLQAEVENELTNDLINTMSILRKEEYKEYVKITPWLPTQTNF